MQFDRDASGKMTPLPRPSIDTGMGLERVATVLQGKLSNFETDLIRPIIERAGDILGISYGEDAKLDTTLRIIADHARAAASLVHDGVLPANEGRGYVLRKIVRRALRHARLAGSEKPFLYEMTGFVAELMKPAYPELLESAQRVARIVKEDEVRYQHSFVMAETHVRVDQPSKKSARNRHAGRGGVQALRHVRPFPRRARRDGSRASCSSSIVSGFESEMAKQRARARASWKGGDVAAIAPSIEQLREQHPRRSLRVMAASASTDRESSRCC